MKVRDISLPRRNVLKVAAAATLLGSLPNAFAQSKKPKIGIIGSGNVGGAIGRSWARAGLRRDVLVTQSRKRQEARRRGRCPCQRRHARTRRRHSAMCCCSRFRMARCPISARASAAAVKGKVVLDACNPFPQRDGDIANTARQKGAGVVSAELLPGARIVRAFNAIGAARMGKAYEEPGKVGMPIAGDDKQAIEIASKLIKDLGYEPVLIGGTGDGPIPDAGDAARGRAQPGRNPEDCRHAETLSGAAIPRSAPG